MQNGKELWEAAEGGTKTGDAKSANVMRVYALNQMLAAAETAVLTGEEKRAAEYLYELQLYAEKLAHLLSQGEEIPTEPGGGLKMAASRRTSVRDRALGKNPGKRGYKQLRARGLGH